MMRTILVLTLLAIARLPAYAQLANPTTLDSTAASFGLGFDHGGILELGYRRYAPRIDGSAHVRMQMPSTPFPGDGGLEAGITVGRVGGHGLGATVTMSSAVRWVVGDMLDIWQGGFGVGAAGGYFRSGGLAALELAWDHSLLTYVHPTEMYRRTVYSEARGGLHGGGGGTLRAGVAASLSLTSRIDLTARAGYIVTEALNVPAELPFYGVLSGVVRL